MLVVLGLFAAAIIGGLALLLAGTVVGIAVAVVLLLAGIAAQLADGFPRRALGSVLLIGTLGAGAYGAILAFDILDALQTTDGPADQADADQLATAETKIDALDEGTSFRLELTEAELQAVVQDGIASSDDIPIRRIGLDLRAATRDVAFDAVFKAGGLTASGVASVTARNGGIDLDLGPIDLGAVQVPGIASGAVESLLDAVTDLNAALAEQRASVQTLEVLDDRLIVTGTRATADVLTNDALLGSIRDQAAGALGSVTAPPERLGPGTVNDVRAPGSPIVLSLGDSLAANVGVTEPLDGYVSRFHNAISGSDASTYGLVNLGVSGETSGSFIASGQLDEAVRTLSSQPAAYVTIDIGANDLLAHLDSADCGSDLRAPACRNRIDQTLISYRQNLVTIFDRLGGAGGATIVFLQAYNPFSLGFEASQQEQDSSAILSELNAVAAQEASARGIVVADGFTPMQGTTAATTHMLDPDPDIHPNAAGHDVLAAALLDAVLAAR